jgi:GntR family transcriptional regulator, transcriptional repressor for pyruvate dehydrogenase complex
MPSQRTSTMAIEIGHSKLSDRVALHVAREIVRGDLKPGDRLTSEPELAALLGVSKPVVRESLRDLASLGLIRVQHGKRTTVQEPSEWNVLDPLLQDAFQLEGRGAELALQLYELRLILETNSAARAAARATPEQVAELSMLAGQLREIAITSADADEFLRIDRAFHDAVARASANEALRQVIRNVHSFLSIAWAQSSIRDGELEQLAAFHVDIADAIGVGDGDRARTIMGRHLEHAAGKVTSQFTDGGVA